jgi:hypothetical protein
VTVRLGKHCWRHGIAMAYWVFAILLDNNAPYQDAGTSGKGLCETRWITRRMAQSSFLAPVVSISQTPAMLAKLESPSLPYVLESHLLDPLGARPGTFEYLSSLSVLNIT